MMKTNEMKKRLMMVCLLAVCMIGALAVYAAPVYAAADGTTARNAIKLKMKQKYTKTWTSENYDKNCYFKFTTDKQGIVTVSIDKLGSGSIYEDYYYMYLYNAKGNLVWTCDTQEQIKNPLSKFIYKVGLKKGTYYLNVDPSFIFFDDEEVESTIKLTFKKTDYSELEANNSKATATKLKLGKMYQGYYGEEIGSSSKIGYMDWYKFKLTKGKKYKIKISNYEELFSGTALIDVIDAKGKTLSHYKYGYPLSENGEITFTAEKNGWYYIKLYNDSYGDQRSYKIGVYKK